MTATQNTDVMLGIFDAIERRDDRRFFALDPQCEFHWPPSLPYGGVESPFNPDGPQWGATWDPLQPTDVQRAMEPRVVAAHGDAVVVLWRFGRSYLCQLRDSPPATAGGLLLPMP